MTGSALETSGTSIRLATPPGQGEVAVTIETPQGVSNSFLFHYDPDGPLPIEFDLRDLSQVVKSLGAVSLCVGVGTVAFGISRRNAQRDASISRSSGFDT